MKLIPLLLSLAALSSAVRAQGPSPAEEKLRQSLIAVTKQVNSLKAENATMQAAQDDLTLKAKTSAEQVLKMAKDIDAVNKEKADEKEAAQKVQDEMKAQIIARDEQIKKYQTTLDKWMAAHGQITDIAKKKEIERSKMAAKAADFERKSANLQSKNVELFKLGSEILTRYEKFGLGEALAAREPFTGITRTKLQTLVDGYEEKLIKQVARPTPTIAP